MNIKKHTKLLKIIGLGVFFIAVINIFNAPSALAYTCKYSGDNGGSQYKGKELQYDGGNCFIWKDPKDGNKADGKRKFDTRTNSVVCVDGAVMADDGYCYDLVKEYTNRPPTNDDGSKVDERVWQQYCASHNEGGLWFTGLGEDRYTYDASRHRCNLDRPPHEGGVDGCTGNDPDSVSANCFAPGMDGKDNIEDEKYAHIQDQTTDKANRRKACEDNKMSWDPAGDGGNGRCNDTPESCTDVRKGKWENGACTIPPPASTKPKPVTPSSAGDPNNTDSQQCGEARTVLIPADFLPGCQKGGPDAIGAVLKFTVTLLSVGIGIFAVASIVYAAILYSSAMDNANQTQQAIGIIRNTAIGLLLYVFMVSILNFLVPGGVIG